MKKSGSKKKFNILQIKGIVGFVTFQMLCFVLFLPLLIFYGPFDRVKGIVVGASIRSYQHQSIARFFLTDEQIKSVLKEISPMDPMNTGEQVEILNFGVESNEKIEVFEIKSESFEGKMIVVYNPKRIAIGYSDRIPQSGETVSAIARRNGAVAAINAGGFVDHGWTGTGGVLTGYLIHAGEVLVNQCENESIRQDTVAFTEEGMLIVGMHTIKQLKSYGVKEGISFGPPLIVNGKPTIENGDGGWGIAPRTALGQTADGRVLMLVIDGRSTRSLGATLKEVQDILLDYGAVNAANLDGGSSTTMVLNGQVINHPSDKLGERTVPTVFMVMPSEGVR